MAPRQRSAQARCASSPAMPDGRPRKCAADRHARDCAERTYRARPSITYCRTPADIANHSRSSAYRMRTMITVCVGLSVRSNTSTTRRFSSRLLATIRQNGVTMEIGYSSEKIGSGHHRRWLARTAATRTAAVLAVPAALSDMEEVSPNCLPRAIGCTPTRRIRKGRQSGRPGAGYGCSMPVRKPGSGGRRARTALGPDSRIPRVWRRRRPRTGRCRSAPRRAGR